MLRRSVSHEAGEGGGGWSLWRHRSSRSGLRGSGSKTLCGDCSWSSWRTQTAGDLDPGTGGLRKVRMADPTRGKGKRGGARVHYLWLPNRDMIYLLFAYSKDEDSTLSEQQKRALRAVVEGIKKERLM